MWGVTNEIKSFQRLHKDPLGKKFETWSRKIAHLMFEFVNPCLELKVLKAVMGDYVFFYVLHVSWNSWVSQWYETVETWMGDSGVNKLL